jgi:hypothetical protein
LKNIDRLMDGLDSLGLTVSATAARYAKIPEIRDELGEIEPGGKLTQDQARRLRDAVTDLRKTLDAEATEKKAFVTETKRWDVDRLLKDPGSMFGEGIFAQLASQAAFDFTEACKCIAFEQSTAAAFHTMRGTEAVLRDFYCSVVRRNRLSEERRMWGPMVKALQDRSKPPPKALLDNLDAIRRNFRNPTQHPEAIYSLDQAQDLFGMVTPVINQMVRLMQKAGS